MRSRYETGRLKAFSNLARTEADRRAARLAGDLVGVKWLLGTWMGGSLALGFQFRVGGVHSQVPMYVLRYTRPSVRDKGPGIQSAVVGYPEKSLHLGSHSAIRNLRGA